MRHVVLSLIFTLILSSQPRAAVQPQTDKTAYAAEVCSLLSLHAQRNRLPVDFFTRLIWKESIFDARAVSPVGAEGIAQFMPGTAKLRGLKNSFDHREALAAAAEYLAFLTEKFGNLGLAAAAYNFGEDGTTAWLGNRRTLPAETEDYVLGITGHAAAEWRAPKTTLIFRGLAATAALPKTAPSWCSGKCSRHRPQPNAAQPNPGAWSSPEDSPKPAPWQVLNGLNPATPPC